MEVLTELEVESGLRLLHIGREPNEVVSMLLESRNCNLVTAMRRDVQKILLRGEGMETNPFSERVLPEEIVAAHEHAKEVERKTRRRK
jgi:hypothetical protein